MTSVKESSTLLLESSTLSPTYGVVCNLIEVRMEIGRGQSFRLPLPGQSSVIWVVVKSPISSGLTLYFHKKLVMIPEYPE